MKMKKHYLTDNILTIDYYGSSPKEASLFVVIDQTNAITILLIMIINNITKTITWNKNYNYKCSATNKIQRKINALRSLTKDNALRFRSSVRIKPPFWGTLAWWCPKREHRKDAARRVKIAGHDRQETNSLLLFNYFHRPRNPVERSRRSSTQFFTMQPYKESTFTIW